MTPICIDIATAATMIYTSETVVRGYIDAGLLPVVKLPSSKHPGEKSRRVLIAVADLEAFVLKHRVAEPVK